MQAMMGYGGVEAEFHSFLILAVERASVRVALSQGSSPQHPFNTRLTLQGGTGRFGEEINGNNKIRLPGDHVYPSEHFARTLRY